MGLVPASTGAPCRTMQRPRRVAAITYEWKKAVCELVSTHGQQHLTMVCGGGARMDEPAIGDGAHETRNILRDEGGNAGCHQCQGAA